MAEITFDFTAGPWRVLEASDISLIGGVFMYARRQPASSEMYIVASDLNPTEEYFDITRIEKLSR